MAADHLGKGAKYYSGSGATGIPTLLELRGPEGDDLVDGIFNLWQAHPSDAGTLLKENPTKELHEMGISACQAVDSMHRLNVETHDASHRNHECVFGFLFSQRLQYELGWSMEPELGAKVRRPPLDGQEDRQVGALLKERGEGGKSL
jgi:hypothetical protein